MNNQPHSPVVTLKDMLEKLAEPRKNLRIYLDSSVDGAGNAVGNPEDILVSPAPGYEVDATSGPKVLLKKLDLGHGNTSVYVELEITTDVRECPEPEGESVLANRPGPRPANVPNPIIGHRWTMSVEHDPSNFTAIRTIAGTVHFRQDMLQKYKYSGDQFRRWFLHPIPIGFRRDPPHIVLAPDGCSVQYVVTDREQILSLVGGVAFGCTDCEVYETRAYVNPVLNPMNNNGAMIGGAIGLGIGGLIPGGWAIGAGLGALIGGAFD